MGKRAFVWLALANAVAWGVLSLWVGIAIGGGECQAHAHGNPEDLPRLYALIPCWFAWTADHWGDLFVALTAAATLLLWWVTRDLVRGADDTARRQLRAYVGLIQSVRVPDPLDTGWFYATLTFKNSGATPAYDFIVWSWIELAPFPLTGPLDPKSHSNERQSRSTLGPGNEVHTTIKLESQLNATDKAAILAGTMAVYVYGEYAYRDAFDRRQGADYRIACFGDTYRTNVFETCNDGNVEHEHKRSA